LDWDQALETTRQMRAALPMYLAIRYLRLELGAAVPHYVIEWLRSAACRADGNAQTAALTAARNGAGGSVRAMLDAAGGARERAHLAWRLLVPAPCYFEWIGRRTHPAALPLRYAARAIRFSFRRIVRRFAM
jgi:hypothetical protein